jgi:hypothetical protein
VATTSYVASIAVNALVTGLITFKIVKVFSTVKANTTSVEKTLGLGATKGTKLQHTIFIIIESAMALFAIQVVRLALSFNSSIVPFDFVVGIDQMLNVIIRSVSFSTSFCFY